MIGYGSKSFSCRPLQVSYSVWTTFSRRFKPTRNSLCLNVNSYEPHLCTLEPLSIIADFLREVFVTDVIFLFILLRVWIISHAVRPSPLQLFPSLPLICLRYTINGHLWSQNAVREQPGFLSVGTGCHVSDKFRITEDTLSVNLLTYLRSYSTVHCVLCKM
jgi:hypothetical protein